MFCIWVLLLKKAKTIDKIREYVFSVANSNTQLSIFKLIQNNVTIFVCVHINYNIFFHTFRHLCLGFAVEITTKSQLLALKSHNRRQFIP